MSSLKYTERNLLEKILGMKTGYVSDFSDRTLREFVLDVADIDIFTEKYEKNGTSKANRIRTFWSEESDELNAHLIDALLKHAEFEKTQHDCDLSVSEMHMFNDAKKIIQRLIDEPETSAPIADEKTMPKNVTEGTKTVKEITSISSKKDSLSRFEKLTNNQTFSIIIGGLILAAILYLIYLSSGINLSNF